MLCFWISLHFFQGIKKESLEINYRFSVQKLFNDWKDHLFTTP